MTAGAAQLPSAQVSGEPRVRTRSAASQGGATFIGAAAAALGLVWLIYERLLPFSGVSGFWLCWYALFLVTYYTMARMQWDRLEARNRLAAVAFGTGGVLAIVIVVDQVGYSLFRGASA